MPFFDRTISIDYSETPASVPATTNLPTGIIPAGLPSAVISPRAAFPVLASILDAPSFAAIGQNIETLSSKINFFKVFENYGSSDESAQRLIGNMIVNDQNPETGLSLSLDPNNTRRIGEITPDYDYNPNFVPRDFSKYENIANVGLGLATTYFAGGGVKGVLESLFAMVNMAPPKTVKPDYKP